MNEPAAGTFVVSAPSGAGKTSLAEDLLANLDGVQRTISWTTREPRNHEVHGVDYFFVSAKEFDARIQENEFLEWAEVHGHRYGTPSAEIARIHAAGDDAVMVIDVQGAEAVRRALPESITIFVLPPSRRALIERLDGRDGLGGGEGRALRLRVAAHEIGDYVKYDYLVVNDDFDIAAAELAAIIRAERCCRRRRQDVAERLLADFRAETTDPDGEATGRTEGD